MFSLKGPGIPAFIALMFDVEMVTWACTDNLIELSREKYEELKQFRSETHDASKKMTESYDRGYAHSEIGNLKQFDDFSKVSLEKKRQFAAVYRPLLKKEVDQVRKLRIRFEKIVAAATEN